MSTVQSQKLIPYFKEQEIWFCSIGQSIGFEQNGSGVDMLRPVVIIKKYSKDLFTGIPLTTKLKNNKYYFDAGSIQGKKSMALLSQIRTLSSKRLEYKISKMEDSVFTVMKSAAKESIFGS